MSEIYLQDIINKVPILSLIIVVLFVVSMENKKHWFLLLPLGLCLVGIYFAQRSKLETRRIFILDMILTLIIIILVVSLFLDPQVETTYQVIVRGIAIVLMSFVAVLVVMSSFTRNLYLQISSVMIIVCLFILSLLWVAIENQKLRSIFSTIITIMFFLFLLQYIASISITSRPKSNQQVIKQSLQRKNKQKQVFSFGSMTMKPL